MLVLVLSLVASLILLTLLFVGGAYFLSERLPKNTPAKYLARKTRNDDQRSVVVFVGDSITHGRIGVNYVEMIEDQLGEERIEFINAGINSELAWNNLQRVDEVIECEPDIVTVLIGSNDANATVYEDSMDFYVRRMKLPRNPDSNWYRESLLSLVKRIKTETSAKIALLSIPTSGADSHHPAFIRGCAIGQIVQGVAEEMKVTYLPLHEKMVESIQDTPVSAAYPYEKHLIGIFKGVLNRYLLRKSWDDIAQNSGFSLHVDYLHLNSDGARIIADLIGEFIQSSLIRT